MSHSTVLPPFFKFRVEAPTVLVIGFTRLRRRQSILIGAGFEPVIEPWHLPPDFAGTVEEQTEQSSLNLSAALTVTERSVILKALRMTDGKRAKAAELLGISRKNLWEKLKHHNLSPQ